MTLHSADSSTSFTSAGFLVTRRVERPDYLSPDLLPEKIISASSCICSFIPDTWAIEWTGDTGESREEEASIFGLESSQLEKVIEWVNPLLNKDIGWPNVCFRLDTAREIKRLFLPSLDDVVIIELALPDSLVDSFKEEAKPSAQDKFAGIFGRQGVYEAVLKGQRASSAGRTLGFEPLVYDGALSCSWLCNGLEKEVRENLGIYPNKQGLIKAFKDAQRCVDYISKEEVGAEPGLWLPWLLIEHPAKAG